VDQLLRHGADLDDSLRATQAAAIGAVLSERQRKRLALSISGQTFE